MESILTDIRDWPDGVEWVGMGVKEKSKNIVIKLRIPFSLAIVIKEVST